MNHNPIHENWIKSFDTIASNLHKKKIITKETHEKVLYTQFQERNLDNVYFCGRTQLQVKTLHSQKRHFVFFSSSKKEPVYKSIPVSIQSLDDLINLVKNNPFELNHEYNIPLKKIHDICPYLKKLQEFIGVTELKNQLLEQILYFLQDLHSSATNNSEYLHTILAGPPGTGKTEIAQIIGQIYAHLGILKKGSFQKVTRSDLIGGYLGQTAIKTKDVIKESLGGVLFIDEAYALGNAEKRDSFSKECIDTLCECLSHYRDQLMVIIAGYDEELQSCFFSYNQGLASRFIWKFKIDRYTGEELSGIIKKKIKDCGWTLSNNTILNKEWFEKNYKWFPSYGRDVENLLTKIKICHSKRIFGLENCVKKSINEEDLKKGFEVYCKNDMMRKDIEKHELSKSLSSIYV